MTRGELAGGSLGYVRREVDGSGRSADREELACAAGRLEEVRGETTGGTPR